MPLQNHIFPTCISTTPVNQRGCKRYHKWSANRGCFTALCGRKFPFLGLLSSLQAIQAPFSISLTVTADQLHGRASCGGRLTGTPFLLPTWPAVTLRHPHPVWEQRGAATVARALPAAHAAPGAACAPRGKESPAGPAGMAETWCRRQR